MVAPAFGFSAGDFISAINLVSQVVDALKDGGSVTTYQGAIQELQTLRSVLEHLDQLRPSNETDLAHVNAIRGMALSCRVPLQEFLNKISTTYASALSAAPPLPAMPPLRRRSTGFSRSVKKVQWGLSVEEDLTKLRAVVTAKIVNISLLLGSLNLYVRPLRGACVF